MDESLALLNKVFTNTNEIVAEPFTDNRIRTPLLPHQVRLVRRMQTHKQNMLYGSMQQDQWISGKLGIVADSPGSGKTLSVLAFVASELDQRSTRIPIGSLHPQSNQFFSSHQRSSNTDSSSVNVILVPPTLLHQWIAEIRTHTNLVPFVLQNRRLLRNRGTPQLMRDSHCILTTNKMYRELTAYSQEHRLHWNNLFIDEATSIYLSPNDPIPTTEFIWFMTSQWHHMLFKNTHLALASSPDLHPLCNDWIQKQGSSLLCTTESSAYYKSIVPWTHPDRHCLVLKGSEEQPQQITHRTVHCRSHYTLANLPMSVLGTNYNGLTHETIPTLFSALGLPSWSIERIKQVHGRADLLDAKENDDCVICLEAPQNTVVLPCCMNRFCGACILRQLLIHGQCPICRSLLVLPCLLPIQTVDSSENICRTKQEACMDYILQNRTQSHLVYTLFENTFYEIQPLLEEQGIASALLDLPLYQFQRTLQQFQAGVVQVLFVSNIDLIRGLTLSKADSLILFSEIPVYERRQILLHSIVRPVSTSTPKKTVLQLLASL